MWPLQDGRDVLAEIDGRFAGSIDRHVAAARDGDLFHASANTDPKGNRSLAPQDQDPGMLVHVTRETDAGIVMAAVLGARSGPSSEGGASGPDNGVRRDEGHVAVSGRSLECWRSWGRWLGSDTPHAASRAVNPGEPP